MSADAPSLHANCVVVGETGVLIRGASGSGKSTLSAALVAAAEADGLFARLVADDRTKVSAWHGRAIGAAPDPIAGRIERRGLGVIAAPYLAETVVGLVVDIEDNTARVPEPGDSAAVAGVPVARMAVTRGDPFAASLVLERLRAL